MNFLPNEVPILKDGKWYICKLLVVVVRGGRQVAYIAPDGTELKREPLHRYKNRVNRRKGDETRD
jgi:hypothetical protein